MAIEFTQKWVEQAVQKLLGKGEIEASDFAFLESFPDLRVADFVETAFRSAKNIENLNRLEQISCYLD